MIQLKKYAKAFKKGCCELSSTFIGKNGLFKIKLLILLQNVGNVWSIINLVYEKLIDFRRHFCLKIKQGQAVILHLNFRILNTVGNFVM